MVINKNGTVKQVTHYYPYGGLIGDISTLLSDVTKGINESVQKYKFEGPRSHQKEIDNLLARRRAFRRGVELDRTFGLDNYDIHARQYFAMAPMWDRIDPLTEDNPQFSPYSYCMGAPVNYGDYNGKNVWKHVVKGAIKVGKTVAKKGIKTLNEGATYSQAFSDIVEDTQTISSSDTSFGEKTTAVFSLASELFSPISIKDAKYVGKSLGIVHGNSKLSSVAQHVYRIFDMLTNKTVKIGISGRGKNKEGKSKRANAQVNKMNKNSERQFDSEIIEDIPEGEGSRQKALHQEKNTLINIEKIYRNNIINVHNIKLLCI